MKKIYGAIDIGGTNIRIATYSDGEQIMVKKFSTPTNIDDAIDEICEFFKNEKLEGIGIGMPGPADYTKGMFLDPPNLPEWHNKNIYELISEKLNVNNFKSDNDANLMSIAYHHHFNKNSKDVTQFLTISTGIGAGLVLDNKIFQGFSGKAMEVAFVPSSRNLEENYLGVGALEYFASGSGLSFRAKKIGINSTKELFESNEKEALEIIKEGVETLGNFIATLVAVINPNTLVFDGSVSMYQPQYIENAMKVAKSKMSKHHWDALDWLIGDLGDNAVLTGAYRLIEGKHEQI